MGIMIDGKWYADGVFPTDDGRFVRAQSGFRSWVTRRGEVGPSGDGGFKAEPGRYHLYISLACPWAHRTLIFRRLKRLENLISLSVVDPFMGENGWAFAGPDGSITPGSPIDDLTHALYLFEIYARPRRDYNGLVTVPVLWDKERRTIVNNESAEIIRMLNSAFDRFTDVRTDYYPAPLRAPIDD